MTTQTHPRGDKRAPKKLKFSKIFRYHSEQQQLQGYHVGPHGCSSTCIVAKWPPISIPGATKGFRRKSSFPKFHCLQTRCANRQDQQLSESLSQTYLSWKVLGVKVLQWKVLSQFDPSRDDGHQDRLSTTLKPGYQTASRGRWLVWSELEHPHVWPPRRAQR